MRASVLAAVLCFSACGWHKLDVRVCLSDEAPKHALGSAIRHRYYTEHTPAFRHMHLMGPNSSTTEHCDIVAVLKSSGTEFGSYSASVVSARSKQELVSVSATGALADAARSLSDQIFAAIDRGTPLHDRIVKEREGK